MLALQQHCNLLSLNLAERPAPGVIGGGLSRGQLCRQNRAGPDRLLLLMEGRGRLLLIIKLGRASSGRERGLLSFFVCYSFLVSGTVGRRGPPRAHMHSWTARIKIIGPWPLSNRPFHVEGVAGAEGRCLGTPNGKTGDGMAPACLSSPWFSFVFASDATAPVIWPSPVSRAAALVVLVGRQCHRGA